MSSKRRAVQLVRATTRTPYSPSLTPAPVSPFALRRFPTEQLHSNETTPARRRFLSYTPVRRLQDARPQPPPETTTSATSSPDPNIGAASESISSTTSTPQEPKILTFADIQSYLSSPSSSSPKKSAPKILLIDVREPAELALTGHIPTAVNVPITSNPDALFLPAQEFEDRFGFPRPGGNGEGGGDEDEDVEVVFYCKSGVRSRQAARLAVQSGFGGKGRVGEFPGSWNEWSEKGGGVER